MRVTIRHRRPSTRLAVPSSKPRNAIVLAFINGIGTLSGKRQRDIERARSRFDELDFDQRVREIGEW
ncbi:hypothetical protein [uncultured Variovorax sp.]|uniref:hypothetical protein n=1 Tax=uncultured Variovorax sp. TaxID=114708 RepID=UPI00260EF909|nr:hypothetical protein [uncultured Variovorax sp.]